MRLFFSLVICSHLTLNFARLSFLNQSHAQALKSIPACKDYVATSIPPESRSSGTNPPVWTLQANTQLKAPRSESRSLLAPALAAVTERIALVEDISDSLANFQKKTSEERSNSTPDSRSRLWSDLAESFGLEIQILEKKKSIPPEGPVLVVANMPQGLVSGLALATAVSKTRPDIQILAHPHLAALDFLQNQLIPWDPLDKRSEHHEQGLQRAIAQLRQKSLLVAFPAAERSSVRRTPGSLRVDRPWRSDILKILRAVPETQIVNAHVDGQSQSFLQLLQDYAPKNWQKALSPLLHLRELAHAKGQRIQVRFSSPREAGLLISTEHSQLGVGMELLRAWTYLLSDRNPAVIRPQQEIRAPVSEVSLAAEKNSGRMRVLLEDEKFEVRMALGRDIPETLQELGRLREISFRSVQEGTGQSVDLDPFDLDYFHLITYPRGESRILGSYRLKFLEGADFGETYVQSLFHIDRRLFHKHLRGSIELGRAFVDLSEGRLAHGVLERLWTAIALMIQQHPEVTKLVGGVSVSSSYSPLSQQLILRFLKERRLSKLARFVRPQDPFDFRSPLDPEVSVALSQVESLGDLNRLIGAIDGKPIPSLLLSYEKLGAEYLAFNVDREFNSVDGLLIIHLMKGQRQQRIRHALEKYFKEDNYRLWLQMQNQRR